MDINVKEKFEALWKKYFNGAELPVVFYYTDHPNRKELVQHSSGHRCLIFDLQEVRKGKTLTFSVDSLGCPGGKRYLGFMDTISPNFEYFLSYGIPRKLEGERYKKTPELVKELMKNIPKFKAPLEFIVFKRWDKIKETDNPEVIIFFCKPDVLSGLFTLANFDEVEPNGIFAPFSAGCGSIVQYPYLERESDRQRGVLGMFDISARPYVQENVLTFSVPVNKFVKMADNMEESFLITPSWNKVAGRIEKIGKKL